MIMIMNKIILRENVENNNNQPYLVNGLTIIIPTVVLRNCYYSLMKLIQSFVPHCSTKSTFALPGDDPRVPVPGPPSIRVRAAISAVQDFWCRPPYL